MGGCSRWSDLIGDRLGAGLTFATVIEDPISLCINHIHEGTGVFDAMSGDDLAEPIG